MGNQSDGQRLLETSKKLAYDDRLNSSRCGIFDYLTAAVEATECIHEEGATLLDLTDCRPGPVTGPAGEKPVFLVHGNLHAGELSGSACALYLAHEVLLARNAPPPIRELLKKITFHIIPRVSVDGAEKILHLKHAVRSREIPKRLKNSIWPEDINGDGAILKMRVPDPNGPWFSPNDEPRLLVPRLPGDREGKRYRLTTEGVIHDWDGGEWEGPSSEGFDFNRNWAHNWRPVHEQWGAGRYPFSEPEVRAIADHIFDHQNVFGLFRLP